MRPIKSTVTSSALNVSCVVHKIVDFIDTCRVKCFGLGTLNLAITFVNLDNFILIISPIIIGF